MRHRDIVSIGVVGVLTLITTTATAATYTLITPYSGAGTTTSVLGLNDAGYMTGSITYADGSADGFVRDPSGVYTTFSAGSETTGRNIGNTGSITGYATDDTGDLTTDTTFVRSPGGTITALTDPTTSAPIHGIAQGQNASGAIVGDYFVTFGGGEHRHGFELSGGTLTDISAGGADPASTTARGINDSGVIVGWALDLTTGVTQGYVDTGGVMSFFADPNVANADTTYFEDINNSGLVSGEFLDAAGDYHPFEFNTATDAFTDLTPPGSLNDDAFGLNNAGEVVLTNSDGSNYLYNPAAVAEPNTWALMLIGLGGVGVLLRRRSAVPLTV
jgi:hypothetical protein